MEIKELISKILEDRTEKVSLTPRLSTILSKIKDYDLNSLTSDQNTLDNIFPHDCMSRFRSLLEKELGSKEIDQLGIYIIFLKV